MGYVGWTALKELKNFEVNLYQMKLKSNMEARERMAAYTGTISDGKITPNEIADDPLNYNNYVEFMAGADAFQNSAQGGGDVSNQLIDYATNQGYDEKTRAIIIDNLNKQLYLEYAHIKQKELSKNEIILDNEKKVLETKLQVAMQELQAIEKAEADAIQKATPKYSGLQG